MNVRRISQRTVDRTPIRVNAPEICFNFQNAVESNRGSFRFERMSDICIEVGTFRMRLNQQIAAIGIKWRILVADLGTVSERLKSANGIGFRVNRVDFSLLPRRTYIALKLASNCSETAQK